MARQDDGLYVNIQECGFPREQADRVSYAQKEFQECRKCDGNATREIPAVGQIHQRDLAWLSERYIGTGNYLCIAWISRGSELDAYTLTAEKFQFRNVLATQIPRTAIACTHGLVDAKRIGIVKTISFYSIKFYVLKNIVRNMLINTAHVFHIIVSRSVNKA